MFYFLFLPESFKFCLLFLQVTRVVLLWVNNHFTDFETDPDMMEFLEKFEACLEKEVFYDMILFLPWNEYFVMFV